MTYTPVIPFGGYGGWALLGRTMAAQTGQFARSPEIQRDMAYFRDKIGSVKTADDLVSDRRLLRIALTAYGLESDLDSRAFIRKVLADGTLQTTALSNRLADKRYLDFSKAFGFGDFSIANTQKSDFADKILSAYQARAFESAVGSQNEDMRIALNARRELGQLASKTLSTNARWYKALASPPLRSFLQTAFGLPASFARIDLDQQLRVLKDRAQTVIGSDDLSALAAPEKLEKLMQSFFARSSSQTGTSARSSALTLLQAATTSSNGLSLYR